MTDDRTMNEFNELKNLVIQSLETCGALSTIRAQIRSSVFKVVDESDDPNEPASKSVYDWENNKCGSLCATSEGRAFAELVKELFQHQKMNYSLSVFGSEVNMRGEVDRAALARDLKLKNDPDKQHQPLLLQILEKYLTEFTANSNHNPSIGTGVGQGENSQVLFDRLMLIYESTQIQASHPSELNPARPTHVNSQEESQSKAEEDAKHEDALKKFQAFQDKRRQQEEAKQQEEYQQKLRELQQERGGLPGVFPRQ